jgi:hypothetical protein
MKELAIKLLAIQKELGAVSKDKENAYFNSNYADINKFIEVVKPVLSKHGIVLLQPPTNINGLPALETILIDSDTGEQMSWIAPLIFKDSDPQKVGSAVTYYRRYALQSTLFIEAEDDDANKASGKKAITSDEPF